VLIKNVLFILPAPLQVRLLMTKGNRVCKYIWISGDWKTSHVHEHRTDTTTAITLCVSHSVSPVISTGFVRGVTFYTTQIALNNLSTVFFALNSRFGQTRGFPHRISSKWMWFLLSSLPLDTPLLFEDEF
jgi:hypothetical protein